MPKETFLKLNQEKKQRIEEAIIKEFSKSTFEKASISNIIEEAKIPRGSFYQYFVDKEDAITYIIEKEMINKHKKVSKFLEEANGDIFETAQKIYEDAIKTSLEENNMQLVKNIMQELRKKNISIFGDKFEKDKKITMFGKINKEKLNIENEVDLKYIMRILTLVTRCRIMEVINQKKNIEENKKELKKELEILKKGMEK